MKTGIKQVLACLLVIIMIAAMLPATVSATDDTIIISTADQLFAFAADVNAGNTYEGKTVTLTVNVCLDGENDPWTPIGTSSAPFAGVFDGGYHVISGLFVPSGSSVGLFGTVSCGTVKNLVVDGSVSGSASVGGMVGALQNGSVENCGNRAEINGANGVGGIVGSLNGACTVNGCFNTGDVIGTTGYIGGVAGQGANNCSLSNCYNTGTISGPATVGGVLGGHKAYNTGVSNSYNIGAVTGSQDNNIGPVTGKTRGEVTNCYYLEDSSNFDSNAYGSPLTGDFAASKLGNAFTDGDPYPLLAWETEISTDDPIKPGFTEKTARSKELAELIRSAVNSAKTHNGVDSASLLGNEAFLSGASSTGTDWMALAMARFGYFDIKGNYKYLIDDGVGYDAYLNALQTYIVKTYAEHDGILHSAKATEWHRGILAIMALGGDPTAFGTYNGKPIDLISDGSYNCVISPGKQGINGWIFGLIALDSGMFETPATAKYPRETFIKEILKMQLTDGAGGNTYGGWVLGGYGTNSDIDITAMAIQALAPYYNDDTVYTYTNENSKEERSVTVRECVEEALEVLSSRMDENGGFSSWGSKNVEGIAQVIVALCSLGINPAEDSRFVASNGKTILDGLLQFRLPDGGFGHIANGEWNYMANDQATYALVSYWRLENGMRALYDMRGNFTADDSTAVGNAVVAIDSLPDPASADYKERIKAAIALFRSVSNKERRYVNNYSSLAAALELVGGEEKLDTDDPFLVRIAVTKQPDKTAYFEGDIFDPTGMEITAYDSKGEGRVLTASEFSVKPSGALQRTDEEILVISGILKTSIAITVEKKLPWKGSGTAEDPYRIDTSDDLVAFSKYINDGDDFAGRYAVLTANLDLSDIPWTPIARTQRQAFAGTFDGQGFAIDNLYSDAGGLFGYATNSAVIKNVGVASGEIGRQTGYSSFFGGIVGWSDGAEVLNCWNGAEIYGSYCGGIVGTVRSGESVISGCFNRGNVTGSDSASRLGGIVGHLASDVSVTIKDCYNTGNIVGGSDVGGIVGGMQDGPHTVSECYNAGTVESVSQNEAVNGKVGAIIGSATQSENVVSDCYYLDSSCTEGGISEDSQITDIIVALIEMQMKDGELLSVLGAAFKADPYGLVNNGYPILIWQNTEDADAVEKVVALIDDIGNVTIESETMIQAARNAYDALEDESLQALVSNYETLVQAEKTLQALKDDNENHSDPSNPTDPDDPTEPSNPSDPTEPSNSDDPTEPSNSDDPTEPSNPSDPTEPSNPDDPTEPSNPDDPTEPSNSDDPIDITNPSATSNTEDLSGGSSSPQTGDMTTPALPIMLILLSVFGLVLLITVRKTQGKR